MKDNNNVVIKGADKEFPVVVYDREDYIKKREKQLGVSNVNEEVPDDPESFISTIRTTTLEKIRKKGKLKKENIQYSEVEDPKFSRFYLLPKWHKRLEDVSDRLFFSNYSYYIKKISVFLDFYLQHVAHAKKFGTRMTF